MSSTSTSRGYGNRNQGGNGNHQETLAAPVHKIRIGKIKVALWENKGDKNGTWFSVTATRSYLDNQKKWHTANSFGKDDLLCLAELLRQACLWIAREHGGSASNVEDDGDQGHGN